jgi:hypothetical protein
VAILSLSDVPEAEWHQQTTRAASGDSVDRSRWQRHATVEERRPTTSPGKHPSRRQSTSLQHELNHLRRRGSDCKREIARVTREYDIIQQSILALEAQHNGKRAANPLTRNAPTGQKLPQQPRPAGSTPVRRRRRSVDVRRASPFPAEIQRGRPAVKVVDSVRIESHSRRRPEGYKACLSRPEHQPRIQVNNIVR